MLSGIASPIAELESDGPGDSGLVLALSMSWERLSIPDVKGAPQISQLFKEG